MLTVLVHEKGGQTQRFDYDDDFFSIGREEDNNLVLDRVNVSKYHLRFRRHQGEVQVEDLESTNGTYLNGRRVRGARKVARGDRIYVGDYILMLDGDEPNLDAEQQLDGKSQDEDSSGVITSAKRQAAAGVESTYLDKLAGEILLSILKKVPRLDPRQSVNVPDTDRSIAIEELDNAIRELQETNRLEDGVDVESLEQRIASEMLEYGPLSALMRDDAVREIQAVGTGPIHVVREDEDGERGESRFTGERALTLAIHRMARKRGFWVDGAQVLEGTVDHGFYLYAVLPPHQASVPILSLRRVRTDASSLATLVHESVLNTHLRDFLSVCLKGCRRLLVCASGGVNLDRFMGAVVGEIPDNMRVACISETGKLGEGRKGWVQIRRLRDVTDTVDLHNLIGLLQRGGLDLLVSQQVSQADAAAVIDAVAGASRGAVASLWGVNTAHALTRLAGLGTSGGAAVQPLILSLARAFDVVVRVGRGVCGESMQIVEVIQPKVSHTGVIEYRPLFVTEKKGDAPEFRAKPEAAKLMRQIGSEGVEVPARLMKV